MADTQGKPYFPMYFDLSQKNVVVVGAGTIAKRRIRLLTDFTEHLTVIAPEVNKELLDLEQAGKIKILRKKYEREDLFGADIVLAASSDNKINNDVHAACKCLGIMVNVCSDRNKCDFFFPGVVHKDTISLGISSQGKDRKEARKIKEQLAALLDTGQQDHEID